METRAKKKQKIEGEKLHSLAIVFPHLVQFLSINDTYNLGFVCKELHRVTETLSSRSGWRTIKELRRPTCIGYHKRKFDEEVGIDFPLDDVTVSQCQPFRFFIISNDCSPPKKLSVRIHLLNDCWEEFDNRKALDLDAPTRARFFIEAHEPKEMLFSSNPLYGGLLNDGSIMLTRLGITWAYGLEMEKFQERGSEDRKNELRRMLAILYACVKRVSTWGDGGAISYPSAEYLMRLLPEAVWPFFPQDFDWAADYSDRATVLEFSYQPAPHMEAWIHVTPADLYDGPSYWEVGTLPWYWDLD